jgi:hypothetical protein
MTAKVKSPFDAAPLSALAFGELGEDATPVSELDPLPIVVAAGSVAGSKPVFVPTLDTSAYAAGDVLFGFTAVPLLTAAGRIAMLSDLTIADKADQGATITLLFANASAALGTINGVPSISDADALKIIGAVKITADDWIDLGGCRVAVLRNLNLILSATSGTDVYVGAIVTAGGTGGTFAADSLQITFGKLDG